MAPGNLAAFVITYRRPAILARTLRTLLTQSRPPDHLLVVDNDPGESARSAALALGHQGIAYHPLGDNLGPAGAAAFGLGHLVREGHDWIYWGDDDDPPKTPDTLARLMATLGQAEGEDLGGVAAVGARWDWRRGELRRLPDAALRGVVEVDAIGGGQQLILRRPAVQQVGLPDPRLFFGLEEFEYCLRIRQAGFRLLVDGELMLENRRLAGRLNLEVRRSPWRRHPTRDLWRRYYTTRNYIFMMREIFHRPDLARREAAKALVRCAASWLHGPGYGRQLSRCQLKAVADGYAARMGRTITPPRGSAEAASEVGTEPR